MLKFESTDEYYSIQLPIPALVLTQLVALAMICVFPYNIQYRIVKPMSFNIVFALFYAFLLFVGVYLSSIADLISELNLEFWQDMLI